MSYSVLGKKCSRNPFRLTRTVRVFAFTQSWITLPQQTKQIASISCDSRTKLELNHYYRANRKSFLCVSVSLVVSRYFVKKANDLDNHVLKEIRVLSRAHLYQSSLLIPCLYPFPAPFGNALQARRCPHNPPIASSALRDFLAEFLCERIVSLQRVKNNIKKFIG